MVGWVKEKLAAISETLLGLFFNCWIIFVLVFSPSKVRQLGHFLIFDRARSLSGRRWKWMEFIDSLA